MEIAHYSNVGVNPYFGVLILIYLMVSNAQPRQSHSQIPQ